MKIGYMIFAGCVFALFCMLEMKGVALDSNQAAPKPDIYTRRSGGSSGGSTVFYSSK
jgi:hypothetical protein